MQNDRRKKTDFQKIVRNLRDWGWGDTELEKHTGVPRTKFAKLRSGAHVGAAYDDGVAILVLYERVVCGAH